jgi:hypothetical protein
LERLHSKFKYNAWNVAWREALLPNGYVGSDQQKTEEQQWKNYNVSLITLREHRIEYET